MKIIKASRGEGKSRKAIKLSAKTGATIVCYDQYSVKEIEAHAKFLGINIPKPIAFDSFVNLGMKPPRLRKVIIEDLDSRIRSALGYWLRGSQLVGITTEQTNLEKILNPNEK